MPRSRIWKPRHVFWKEEGRTVRKQIYVERTPKSLESCKHRGENLPLILLELTTRLEVGNPVVNPLNVLGLYDYIAF